MTLASPVDLFHHPSTAEMWPPPLCPLDLCPGPIGTSNWLIRPPVPLSPPQLSSLPGPGLIAGSHPGSVSPHENESNLQALIAAHHVTAFVNLLSTERLSFVSYEPRARDIAAASHRTLTFLACPILDGGVAEDDEVLFCCREVLELLKAQHVVYVHCWGGHGRTGVVASIALGLVYGLDGPSSMAACQARHSQRLVQTGISSPQSPAQCRQVTRILAHVQTGTPLALSQPPPAWLDAASESAVVTRSWLPISAPLAVVPPRPEFVFAVMTWNTLASSLCSPAAFPAAAPAHLTLAHRRSLFLQEFRRVSADLICLVEVDGADWEGFFFPFLHAAGFDAFWVKKPGKDHEDGSCFAYRRGKFAMMDYKGRPLVSDDAKEVWSCVCLVAQLAPILDGHVAIQQRLVVAALHLKAKAGNEGVRLRQAVKALEMVEETVERLKRVRGDLQLSTLLCGDFNDTPEPTTPVHHFVLSGQTPPVTVGVGEAGKGEGVEGRAAHVFWFHSLYDRYYAACSGGGEYWTTVKKREVRVQRVIDFIFFSPTALVPLELLSIPRCHTEEGYPAADYPSDHLALAGRFQLLPLTTHALPIAAVARHKL